MNSQTAAIAVFVKTPGQSPIKTRLAAGIGAERSEQFYHLSVAAIEATVAATATTTGATPYWAVAEVAGLDNPLWQHSPRVSQGEGNLGDRLHKVFNELISQHSTVILLGADSPQLTPLLLKNAIQSLGDDHSPSAHIMGRTHDGGFYLFGSNTLVPKNVWSAVPYSTANTAESLATNLRSTGQIKELALLTDVDQLEDLGILKKELLTLSEPTPEQISLSEWLEQAISDFP